MNKFRMVRKRKIGKDYSKRSQVLSLDLIVAITIFITGLVIFFRYGAQIYSQNSIQYLTSNAESLSEKIISPGYPENWSSLNLSNASQLSLIQELGICKSGENNIIDNKKLNELINLTNTDYGLVKNIERSAYNFIIEIPSKNISFGSESYNKTETKNEVSINRIVMLNNSLIEIKIIVFN